jgi:hypothetical protein
MGETSWVPPKLESFPEPIWIPGPRRWGRVSSAGMLRVPAPFFEVSRAGLSGVRPSQWCFGTWRFRRRIPVVGRMGISTYRIGWLGPKGAGPHRLVAEDTTLSRWRHGFESRWGCHSVHNPNRVDGEAKRRVDLFPVLNCDPMGECSHDGLASRRLTICEDMPKLQA